MTRFKELRRIEAAILHKNQSELEWAESFCKHRLSTAQMKSHEKYYRKLLGKLDAAQNTE